MKSIFFSFFLASLFLASSAQAQWQTTTYSLKAGWSAIYLTGDAKQASLSDIFPAQVVEVWRWNSNPTQVQFTESPGSPSPGTPEWSVWKRGFPLDSTFSELTGQTSYLVKSTGAANVTFSAAIKQTPLAPKAVWVRNGANLMGFPTLKNGVNFPTFSSYFATFPGAIAANTKIFKYIGGELSGANPMQVLAPVSERLDRTQAYWFSAEVVENFYAPVEINLSTEAGLDFGNSGSIITARIRNRAANPVTLTFTPLASESPPTGQPAITGPVPLTRRIFNTTTAIWNETPITSAITAVIAARGITEIQFGVNRGAMVGPADAMFASLLRVTDSGNLVDLILPARAQQTSLTGLWVGDVRVSEVASKVPGSPGTSTPDPFQLRTLLHVADGGNARLLSQVFIGRLAVAPNNLGLCTRESLLKQDSLGTAQRLVAAHLPLDQVISAVGSVAVPGSLTCNVTVPFNDPTNPFVHQYHPDHDNKNARFAPLSAGVESYNIGRACTFNFTATPPAGSSVTSGWGSSVLGGIYTEIISGVHKDPITVSGTFELRRASEIGTLSQ